MSLFCQGKSQNTAFDGAFDIATLIATFAGADVTIVGNITVQNNPTYSAFMLASVTSTFLRVLLT